MISILLKTISLSLFLSSFVYAKEATPHRESTIDQTKRLSKRKRNIGIGLQVVPVAGTIAGALEIRRSFKMKKVHKLFKAARNYKLITALTHKTEKEEEKLAKSIKKLNSFRGKIIKANPETKINWDEGKISNALNLMNSAGRFYGSTKIVIQSCFFSDEHFSQYTKNIVEENNKLTQEL